MPGGGTALIRVSRSLNRSIVKNNDSYNCGVRIVQAACAAPLCQILQNAGIPSEIISQRVKRQKGNQGYDVRNEKYCDMLESGIIDPAKVVKSSMRHAAVAACNLLSVGCAITIDDAESAPAGPGENSALLFS